MRLNIDLKALLGFLEGNPDAEQIGSGEYVVDLFELDRPTTMEISVKGGDVSVLGAAYLEFDQELQGWYMSDTVTDAAEAEALLKQAMEAHG
ncbi:MAG: hypothetical protein IK056_08770 [Clostridia bacterium]|nr:hypothetical protein [Clostridia bacterium]